MEVERTLISDREAEVLRGDADDELANPADYRSKVRRRVKARIDRLGNEVGDLRALLPELASDAEAHVCQDASARVSELEARVEELETKLEAQQAVLEQASSADD